MPRASGSTPLPALPFSGSHREPLSREGSAISVLEQLVPSLPGSLEDPLHSASQPAAPRRRKFGENLGVKVEFPPLRPAAFGLREAWVTPPVAVA